MKNGKWEEVEGFTDAFNDDELCLYRRAEPAIVRAMKQASRARPAAGRLSFAGVCAIDEAVDGLRGILSECNEASERAKEGGRKVAAHRIGTVGVAVASYLRTAERLLSNAWSELQRRRCATQTAINNARRFARRIARSAPKAGRSRRSARPVAKIAASGGGGGDDGSGLDPAPKAPAAFSSARRPTFASILRTTGGAL